MNKTITPEIMFQESYQELVEGTFTTNPEYQATFMDDDIVPIADWVTEKEMVHLYAERTKDGTLLLGLQKNTAVLDTFKSDQVENALKEMKELIRHIM